MNGPVPVGNAFSSTAVVAQTGGSANTLIASSAQIAGSATSLAATMGVNGAAVPPAGAGCASSAPIDPSAHGPAAPDSSSSSRCGACGIVQPLADQRPPSTVAT